MFVRRWASEQPPFSIALEDRRISMRAGNQVFDESPFVGEGSGAIETHSIGAESFRSHIEIVFPSEHVWVRKVKWFLKNNSFVVPGKAVAAGGVADVAFVGLVIQDLKKHVPQTVDAHHERVSDKARRNICHVGGGNYRVGRAWSSGQLQRRFSGVHGDGPSPWAAGVFGALSYSFGINDFHGQDNFINHPGVRSLIAWILPAQALRYFLMAVYALRFFGWRGARITGRQES